MTVSMYRQTRLARIPHAALLALPLLGLLCLPATARDAGCRIVESGKVMLNNTCDFNPEGRDGSFVLTARAGRPELYPGVVTLSVSMIGPGAAEVRGLTPGGINSRWGTARRSARDRACWQGQDFEVCVR